MKWVLVKKQDVRKSAYNEEKPRKRNQRETPQRMQYQVSQHLQCKYCWPMSIYFHINRQLNNIIPFIVRVQIEQCGTDLRNVNGRHRFSYINFHLSPSLSLSSLFSVCLSFAYRYFSLVCVFGEKKSEKETSIAFATVTCLCTSAWN